MDDMDNYDKRYHRIRWKYKFDIRGNYIVGSVSRNGDRVQIEIILCKMIKKSEPGY